MNPLLITIGDAEAKAKGKYVETFNKYGGNAQETRAALNEWCTIVHDREKVEYLFSKYTHE